MTRTTLAVLSALAFASLTLPAGAAGPAGGWESDGNAGREAQDEHAAVAPTYGGGWPAGVTGEAGGEFQARSATPGYGGGQSREVTGEAGGGFARATATRLGGEDGGAGLSTLRAVEGG